LSKKKIMSDHKRSLCTPKILFLEGFFVVRHTESYHWNIYTETHIIYYLYIFTWKFFVLLFFFSLSFCLQGCITIFLKGGPPCIPHKAPFFQLCPFWHLFFCFSWIKKNRTGTRFYWDFANVIMIFSVVVMWDRVNHHNWQREKKALLPLLTSCPFSRSCALMYIYRESAAC